MATQIIKKLIKIVILVTVLMASIMPHFNVSYAAQLTNTDEQYMELKVVSVRKVEGQDRQVILEWWSYNLNFKGLDLRFSYDESLIKPSSVQDNSFVTDESSFAFAGDFSSYLRYRVLTAQGGTYRCYMSLNNYDDSGTYIEKDTVNDDYFVNTNVDGGVLIGRMSFRLYTDNNLTPNTFSLQTAETTPTTGIKISKNYIDGYEDQSVFRFSVLSSDAELTGIKYDFFNYIDDGNGNETMQTIEDTDYTELDLSSPEADSTDTLSKYKINLEEYLDNISLKLQLSEENAEVKINGEVVDTGQSKELVLNSLGEEDTVIEILVTAQDGTTTHTYEITIHRPFGKIKGSIFLKPMESTGIYKGTVRVYDSDDVNDSIDWTTIQPGKRDDLHDQITALDSIDKDTEDDGSYEIYLLPGTYDVLLDRKGYLDRLVQTITVTENSEIDLGEKELFAGDLNKDGVIQLLDLSMLYAVYQADSSSSNYDDRIDINDDGKIQLLDLSALKSNYEKNRIIE